MEISGNFNPISAQRARDLLGVSAITDSINNIINVNILPDLADAKKRLDTGGQPITYYGAKPWFDGDAIVDSQPAIMTALNAGPYPDRAELNIPRGDFRVETEIYNTKSVSIFGKGKQHSRFISRTPGLIVFSQNTRGETSTIPYARTFSCKHMSFMVDGYGPGCALDIRQDGTYAGFQMEDVEFNSFNGSYNWKDKFMRLQGVVGGVISRCKGPGGAYNDKNSLSQCTPIGVHIYSQDNTNKVYGVTFNDCQFAAVVNAVLCQIDGVVGDSGTIEGIVMRDCFMRSCLGAAFRQYVPRSYGMWKAPLYIFDGTNTEGPGSSMDIDSATDVYITKGWFVQGPTYDGSSRPLLHFGHVDDVHITNSKLIAFDDAKLSCFLAMDSGIPRADGSNGGVTRAVIRDLIIDPAIPRQGANGATFDSATAIGNIPDIKFYEPTYTKWIDGKTKYIGTSPNRT